MSLKKLLEKFKIYVPKKTVPGVSAPVAMISIELLHNKECLTNWWFSDSMSDYDFANLSGTLADYQHMIAKEQANRAMLKEPAYEAVTADNYY